MFSIYNEEIKDKNILKIEAIELKLKDKAYTSFEEFERDLKLLYENAHKGIPKLKSNSFFIVR